MFFLSLCVYNTRLTCVVRRLFSRLLECVRHRCRWKRLFNKKKLNTRWYIDTILCDFNSEKFIKNHLPRVRFPCKKQWVSRPVSRATPPSVLEWFLILKKNRVFTGFLIFKQVPESKLNVAAGPSGTVYSHGFPSWWPSYPFQRSASVT